MARPVTNLNARLQFKQRLILGMFLKPVRAVCDHCEDVTPSDMQWRCGYCGHDNSGTRLYSFLNKCQKCKREPKSYGCASCSKINFLDDDRDASRPARRPTAKPPLTVPPPPPPPPEDPGIARKKAHDERLTELAREIELAQLALRLAELKASPLLKKEKTNLEQLEESLATDLGHGLGAHAAADKWKEKLATEFKDNPDLRAKADAVIDRWLEKQF